MLSDSPLSIYLCGLLVFLPGIWLCGYKLAGMTFSQPVYIKLTSTLLAILLWLLCTHSIGLMTHSFTLALILGSALPALYGYLFCRLRVNQQQTAELETAIPKPILLASLMGTIWILPAVIFWDFHDKLFIAFGHFSITNQILNDIYPPRDFVFPQYELSYHYGVDTLFAMLSAVTRLSVPVVIDIATVVAWWYSLVLFGLLTESLYGRENDRKVGFLGTLVGGFGGGFIWFLGPIYEQSNNIMQILTAEHILKYENSALSGSQGAINSSTASYLFQHPWSIGLPILLTLLLVWNEIEHKRNQPGAVITIWLGLLVLSFSQGILFLTLSASMLGVSILQLWPIIKMHRHQLWLHLSPLLTLLLSIVSTYLILPWLGGMFRETAISPARVIYAQYGIAGSLEANVVWHLATFGFLLPAGIIGILLSQNLRLLLSFLVAGSILVLNVVQHEHSYNIIKFATVAQIVLSIASAAVVARLLNYTQKSIKVLSIVLFLALTNAGIGFHLAHWLNQNESIIIALWRLEQKNLFSSHEKITIALLRRYIQADEVVLCPSLRLTEVCSILGGFSQLQPYPYSEVVANHDPQALTRRRNLYATPNLDFSQYAQEHVRWAIIPVQLVEWQPVIKTWQQQGYARLVAQFGNVQLYRLAKINTP